MATFSLGDAVLNLQGNVAPLNKALGEAERNFKRHFGNIANTMKSIGTTMTLVGGAITGAFIKMTSMASKYADDLSEMSERTGMSTTALQELSYAAAVSGTSIEKVEKAIGILSKTIYKSGEDFEDAKAKQEKAVSDVADAVTDAAEDFRRAQESEAYESRETSRSITDDMRSLNEARQDQRKDLNEYSIQMRRAEADILVARRKGRKGLSEYNSAVEHLQDLRRKGPPQADSVREAQLRLNRAIEDAQKPNYRLVDAQNRLITAQEKYNDVVKEGVEEQKKAEGAFAKIGLKMVELEKLKPDELFFKVADALRQVQNPVEKSALAMQIFGKSGRELIPMINNMGALREKAHALGLVFGPEALKKIQDAEDKWAGLKMQLIALAVKIGSQLIPTFEKMMEKLTPIIQAIGAWIEKNPGLIMALAGIGAFLVVTGPFMIGLASFIGFLIKIGPLFTLIGSAIGPVIGFFASLGSGIASLIGGAAVIGSGGFLGLIATIGGLVGAAGIGWAIGRWIDESLKKFKWYREGIAAICDALVRWIEKLKELIGLGAPKASAYLGSGSTAHLDANGNIVYPPGYVPPRAQGGPASGLTLVGERGPEIINAPSGSMVYSNDQTNKILGALSGVGSKTIGPINLTINANGPVTDAVAIRTAKVLAQYIEAHAS